MKKDREKEIKYLIYLKSELIKQTKYEIKELHNELNMINGYKRLERKKNQ
jgi:plasmid replication initiation protein